MKWRERWWTGNFRFFRWIFSHGPVTECRAEGHYAARCRGTRSMPPSELAAGPGILHHQRLALRRRHHRRHCAPQHQPTL